MLIKAASLFTAILLAIPFPIHPMSVTTVETTVGTGTPGSCTEANLNAAVDLVNRTNDAVRIYFNCGSNPVTIPFTSQKTFKTHTAVVFEGDGLITFDGQNQTRLIYAEPNSDVHINNLTMTRGKSTSNGGAIYAAFQSSLSLDNVTFTKNVSTFVDQTQCDGGGAVALMGQNHATIVNSKFLDGNQAANGGALSLQMADLTISNTIFSGNSALSNIADKGCGGGAIVIDGVYPGGKISIVDSSFLGNSTNHNGGAIYAHLYGTDQLSISRSTFDQNSAKFPTPPNERMGNAGAVWVDGHNTPGAPFFSGTVSITSSTLSQNHADYLGGAIYAWDAAINLTNLTIDSNSAKNSTAGVTPYAHGDGGGIVIGTSKIKPTTNITNVTFRNNIAGVSGDAIETINAVNSTFKAEQYVQLVNTIVVNTLPSGSNGTGKTCNHPFNDLGGNIQYPSSSASLCSTNILIANPILDKNGLAVNNYIVNNFSGLKTIALEIGSPAIDHGVTSSCPITDARGFRRVGNCDSGAYEFGAEPFRPSHWSYLPSIWR